MKHGLTWETVLPVLESLDTLEEIQEAVSDPESFFADLAEDGVDIGKKVLLFKAISKLKAKLEPMLTSHGLQWSAVLSLLQAVSIDELQKALSDPESFLSDLVGSMGSSVEAAEAEAEASVEVEAEEAAAAATVAETEATVEEAEAEEEEEAEAEAEETAVAETGASAKAAAAAAAAASAAAAAAAAATTEVAAGEVEAEEAAVATVAETGASAAAAMAAAAAVAAATAAAVATSEVATKAAAAPVPPQPQAEQASEQSIAKLLAACGLEHRVSTFEDEDYDLESLLSAFSVGSQTLMSDLQELGLGLGERRLIISHLEKTAKA